MRSNPKEVKERYTYLIVEFSNNLSPTLKSLTCGPTSTTSLAKSVHESVTKQRNVNYDFIWQYKMIVYTISVPF